MPSPGTANFRATLVDSQGEDDIADALLAATSPTAANPFATADDLPGPAQTASDVTVSPSVAGASDVQAMGEALEARVAAFVEPTTATPEAIANALIDAGLMEAS